MQTQYKLSATEKNDAFQGYIAKHQRSRNVKVTEAVANEDGSVTITAEVEVQHRAPKGSGKGTKTTAKKAPKGE